MEFAPPHTWIGDVTVTLIAPGGTSRVVFGRTGSDQAFSTGGASDLAGPYYFSDLAPVAPTWWDMASSLGNLQPVPQGAYRASTLGGTATSGANALLTPAFTGLPSVNGTWTLRVTDNCGAETGGVGAARLFVTTDGIPPDGDADGIPDSSDACPGVPGPPPTGCPDTTAPETSFTAGPDGISKALKVSFGFASSEAGSTFLCSLDGAVFSACTSPTSFTLHSGRHTYRVAARDAVGNTDATPASAVFMAYDCPTLTAKVVTLKKKVRALKKAIRSTKAKLARAKEAGKVERVEELRVTLAELVKKLKRAKKKLAKAKLAAEPCRT